MPLHYAAAKGNAQAVCALLKIPSVVIDATTMENGNNPLHFAALEGRQEVAELLIDAYKQQNKEIDMRDNQDMSALQYAASGPRENMNRKVAELLIKHGADPTQLLNNRSPLLSLSAVAGNFSMVEYWTEEISGSTAFFSQAESFGTISEAFYT
mmetsp:Transcript_6345/g.14352  ORF Transcript_6345/g.14352 Transcript_6345/m.14352 type:complete len:154 (-) Transcript_6345:5834-6295(-)